MITSKQNQKIKEVVKLSDKKYRDSLGLYIIEGIKLTREAKANGVQAECVYCTEKCAEKFPEFKSGNYELVTEEVFKTMSYEVTPEGVLMVAKKPKLELKSPSGLSLLLDRVSDPSNVGAIIRTAAASGYTDIYLVDCADSYSAKAVRSSMGGVFKVNAMNASLNEVLDLLDCPLVVADMSGERMDRLKISEKFCLVIGNEAHGVSLKLKEQAKYTVSIPMENQMESLNASVSAGILMYALKNR